MSLRAAIGDLPGMDRVVPALDGQAPAYLVGGALRDLIRGEPGADLDVAVEGDAAALAAHVAEELGGGRVTVHDRFGTASVEAEGVRLDLAATRRERYPAPGALPEVEPAALADDLARRDFTINALAAPLSGEEAGELVDPHGGKADIDAGVVRVLHPASFDDDPIRLLRAARYAARFGYELEPSTAEQARSAVAAGALATVSADRIREALLAVLGEEKAPDAVRLLDDLGAVTALHPSLEADPELVASAKLGALETGADPELAALAALCTADPATLEPWIASLGFDVAARDAVATAAAGAPTAAKALRPELPASEIRALLAPLPPEGLALALALGAPAEPVLRFVAEIGQVTLDIDGGDLLAEGVPESPAIGRALRAVLRMKLDGEVRGRDAELRAALELARSAEAGNA